MSTYRQALIPTFSSFLQRSSALLAIVAVAATFGSILLAQDHARGQHERIAPARTSEARGALPAAESHETRMKLAALETLWNRTVGSTQIRQEVERLAARTPKILRKWVESSDDDLGAAVERFVRPALVDRMLRESYAMDPNLHASLRQRAEAELATCSSAADLKRIGDEYVNQSYRRPEMRPRLADWVTDALAGYSTSRADRDAWLRSLLGPPRKMSAADLDSLRARLVSSPLKLEEDERSFFVRAVVDIDEKRVYAAEARWFKRDFDQWWTEVAGSLKGVTPQPVALDQTWEYAILDKLAAEASSAGSCPQELGRWGYGPSYTLAKSGNYAYVGSGTMFLVVNVTDPAAPAIVGQLDLENTFYKIVVSGNYAYAAGGLKGLCVINISDPTTPVLTSTYVTPGLAVGLDVVGSTAYVADLTSLQIINVSDPASPASLGSASASTVSGYFLDVAVGGAYAYATTYSSGVKVFDISNPSAPTQKGTASLNSATGNGIAVSGNYAYVAAGTAGLKVVNVTSPTSPFVTGTCSTGGDSQRVRYEAPYVYLADGDGGLAIISVATPTAPTLAGSRATEAFANDVSVNAGLAYVADGGTGLYVIRVDNPTNLTVQGQLILPGPVRGVAISGSLVYVAADAGGLWIVDASDATVPFHRSFIDTPGECCGVSISGNFAYVADGSAGLQVINVTNPDLPTAAGSYDTNGTARSVAISGNYAYVADGYGGLKVINVGTPASPTLAASFATPDYAIALWLSGNYAYLADAEAGLRIINISNPLSPLPAGSVDTPGAALDVALSGNYAYVADYDEGLQVIDVSSPASPTTVTSLATPGEAWGISMYESNVYLADALSGIRVYDVSTPSAPTLLGSLEDSFSTVDTAAREGLVAAANTSYGLLLLSTCATTSACPTVTILTVDTSSCPSVKVQVSVIDANQQPVTGLTAGAFTLTEDAVAKTFMLTSLATAGQYQLSYTTSKNDGAQHALDIGVTVGSCNQHATGNYTLCGGTPPPPSRIVRVIAASGPPGGTVSVPIELVSQGNENAIGFSLTYDTAILSAPGTMAGADAPGATFNANTNQTGKVGISLALPAGQSFAAGTREVVVVQFTIASTTATSTPIGFGDQPIAREVSDATANVLSATWTGGTVTIASGYEADVAPRASGGNGSVSTTDWVQVGRFAAGLDVAAAGSEFQKADCAPRSSLGNGAISTTDWVQAGRYAAGLDPLTSAGGPTSAGAAGVIQEAFLAKAGAATAPRTLAVTQVTLNSGQSGSVPIVLESLGDENALGFSVSFDTASLTFTDATLGSGATGASLNVNDSQKASGRVGILVALPAGQSFAAGQRQIVVLSFTAATVASNRSSTISFGDQPIMREVADVTANTLSCRYFDGAVAIVTGAPVYSQQLVFPQFVDGGGMTSRFTVFGSPDGTDAVVGRMRFFNSDGSARSVMVGGVAGTERLFSLGARGSQFSASANVGDLPIPGWTLIETTEAVNGMAGFDYKPGATLLYSASALGVPPSHKIAIPVEDATKTGVAIVNPGDASINVRLLLIQKSGAQTEMTPPSLNPLAAKRHLPQFVNELTGQAGFQGTLVIEVVGAGSVAATGLYLNEGVLSGLPVVIVE